MIDQIIIGAISAAFAGGGAWFGTQLRIKSVERRLDAVEKQQGTIANRVIRLITSHNRNHGDDIDTNRIDG